MQDIFSCNFRLDILPVDTFGEFVTMWMETTETLSVSSRGSSHVNSRVVSESSVGNIILVCMLIAFGSICHCICINVSCAFSVCREVVKRLGSVRSFITSHQLLR